MKSMKRDKTEYRESEGNDRFETPGKSKTAEVISRCNTIFSKVYTETIGKNRKITEITEERIQMELGRRTRRRFQQHKETTNRENLVSLCKGQR